MAVQQHGERLLERDEALCAVDELLEALRRGEGSALTIQATAGLGKTALLAAARTGAAIRDLDVASARGGELEHDFPFGVVRQLLEPLVAGASGGRRDELFEGAARLAARVVGTAETQPAAAPPGGLPAEAAGAAMHGLYWLVANAAERAPLLLLVDDAHWADAPSLGWLHYLTRRLDGLPVAVIVAARPGEPGADVALVEAIAAEPVTQALRLGPLTRQGSDAVVRRALGATADEEFCAVCHAATGGNPFLLEELLGALARAGVEPVAARAATVRSLVPDTVAHALVQRLRRLPAAAGDLARAVAILGVGAPLHEAAVLAGLDDGQAARAAATLAGIAILARDLPLDFVHPLVRAAVYDDIPAPERAVLHGRAARVLAAAGSSSERVAAQLLRTEPAGDQWVVTRLRAAAADAMARADARAAVACLRRAFAEPVRSDDRIPAVRELTLAGFMAADAEAGEGLFDDAAEADLRSDPRLLETCAYETALGLWIRGRANDALEVLDGAMAIARAAGDLDRGLHLEVRRLMLAQTLPKDALRRLAIYDGSVDRGSFAGRLLDASAAWFEGLTGRSAEQVSERYRRAFDDARLIDELRDDAMILVGLLLGLAATDDLDRSEPLVEHMLDHGRARGSAIAVGSAFHLAGHVAFLRGDVARAEADALAAATVYRDIGAPPAAVPVFAGFLIGVLTERGDLAAAEHELTAAGLQDAVPDHWWYGDALRSRAYLRLALGRTDDGIEDLVEFGRRRDRDGIVPTIQWPWASIAAPALASRGDQDTARRLAERELDEARTWGTPRAVGQAMRGLGLVVGGSDGIELLRESVRTLEASPARLEQARALIDLGASLRRANQRAQAREPLTRGLDLAHRCGARLLEEQATQELRATGARPRKLVLTGLDALTASERRIADLAAGGRSNREIAQALFVTQRTVETHLTHAYTKLGVQGRTALSSALA